MKLRIEKPFLGWDFRGAGLSLILLCSHLAILSVDQFYQYNIPMAEVIRRFNATFHFFFVLIIFGEVFTTLVGNVFGMTKQMQSITGWKNNNIIFFILLISYCFSYIGYSDLLHILYPIIGWVSIVILPIIAFKQLQKHKSIHVIGCFLCSFTIITYFPVRPISNAKYGFNCNRIIRLGMRSKTN